MGSISISLGSLRQVIKVDLTRGFLLKNTLEQQRAQGIKSKGPKNQCSQTHLTGGTGDSEFFLDADPKLPTCAHASRYDVLQRTG